jgi:DNA-binding MarR family transcriptional regulator
MSDEINPAFGDTPSIKLFRLVLTLATHLRTRMDQRLSEIGLTTQQAAVLTYLADNRNPANLGAVAAALGTSHQNARQIVDVLERKGLVAVGVDPEDRRARRITATGAVAAVFADRDSHDRSAVAEWLSGLTEDEQMVAARLLNRILLDLRR